MFDMFLTGFILAASIGLATAAQDRALLSTIAAIPELSTFSSVVNASGGNRPNPAFEERFNSALDLRNYTALVPTNDAFAKISKETVDRLTAPPAYPLFQSIIRTHIAEGLVKSADIVKSSPITAIEGFPLAGLVSGNDKAVIVNKQAKIVAVDGLASNGVTHQIDQVLNPYTSYFGISNATSAPSIEESSGTLSEGLLTDPRLSSISITLQAIQPDLLDNRLKLAKPDNARQIFAIPSNDAFAVLPGGALQSAIAPSNQELSSQLFTFGLLNTDKRLGNLNLDAGPASVANIQTGISLAIARKEGGAVFLNNAAIQAEKCQSNGCLWILDRALDPLYLAFGPIDRK